MEIPDEFILADRHYRLCVVDADIVCYRAACAAEKTEYELYDGSGEFVKRFTSAKDCKAHLEELEEFLMEDVSGYERRSIVVDGGIETAEKALRSLVKQIKRNISADTYRFYLTGTDNFRKEVATIRKYKGNRTAEKPKYLEAMRQLLVKEYDAKVIDTREADDAVSVSLWNAFKKLGVDCDVVLEGIDKDLDGTPGVHHDFIKNTWKFITEEEADRNLFKQALTGDRIDNIGGLQDLTKDFRERYNLTKRKGVGIKTAEALIETCANKYEMYERVLEAYFDWYGYECLYRDWRGNTRLKSFIEIADENIELVFMEREKGVRWDQYKWNYLKEN